MIAAQSTGVTTFTTPSDTEIVMTRTFDAPQRLLWAAYTEPKHIRNWMLGPDGWSMTSCEMDLRVGGAWRIEWQQADGSPGMQITGTFISIDPIDRLVQTERWGPEWPENIQTTAFSESGGRTTVTQTLQLPSLEARDAAMNSGMTVGVEATNDRLENYLRTLV